MCEFVAKAMTFSKTVPLTVEPHVVPNDVMMISNIFDMLSFSSLVELRCYQFLDMSDVQSTATSSASIDRFAEWHRIAGLRR